MKATFSTFAFLFSFFSIYAQKEPIVTDRPIFFDSFAKESLFLESVYDYYEEQIKDLPSGDEIKYFGYYSPGRNSSVKALVTSDTIEFIISLKPMADISKYNLVAIKLFYNAVKNRREALVGFKQGITRVFAPLTSVKTKIVPLDNNVFAIRIAAKPGDEFGLFFGPVRDGVPTNRMYCASSVAAPNVASLSSK